MTDGSVTNNKLKDTNLDLLGIAGKMAEAYGKSNVSLHPNSPIHIVQPLLLQAQATIILTSTMIEILNVLERMEKK